MGTVLRWLAAVVVLLALLAPPLARAANLETTADRVFGQLDFSQQALMTAT